MTLFGKRPPKRTINLGALDGTIGKHVLYVRDNGVQQTPLGYYAMVSLGLPVVEVQLLLSSEHSLDSWMRGDADVLLSSLTGEDLNPWTHGILDNCKNFASSGLRILQVHTNESLTDLSNTALSSHRRSTRPHISVSLRLFLALSHIL